VCSVLAKATGSGVFLLRPARASLRFGVFEAMAHFVEDVEMVLDVLNGAVFREFVQEGFNLLFGVGHYGFVANIPLWGVAQAALPLRMSHPLQKAQRMGHPPRRMGHPAHRPRLAFAGQWLLSFAGIGNPLMGDQNPHPLAKDARRMGHPAKRRCSSRAFKLQPCMGGDRTAPERPFSTRPRASATGTAGQQP
jgi:hypothetical protein